MMEEMEDHNFDFCDCALDDHRLTINIKDEIVECGFVEVDSDNVNQLCMACLCATRTTQKLSDDTLKQFYMDILREMEMLTDYDTEVSPRICWECVSILKKFVCFRKQVKESYAILQPMLQFFDEGLDNFLQTSLCRPGRLKICVADSVDIRPGCDDDGSKQFAPVVVKVESVGSDDAVCPDDDDDDDDDDDEGVTEMRFVPDIVECPDDDDDERTEQQFPPVVINLGLRDGIESPGDDDDDDNGDVEGGRPEQQLAPAVINLGLRDGTEYPDDDDDIYDGNIVNDDDGGTKQQLAQAVINLNLRDVTEYPDIDDGNIVNDDDEGTEQQLTPVVINSSMRDDAVCRNDDRASEQPSTVVFELGTGETGVWALEENIQDGSYLLEHSVATVYEEDFEAFALKHSHITDLDDLMCDELSSNPNFQDKYDSEQTEQIEHTGVLTRSKSNEIEHIVGKSGNNTTALVGRSKKKKSLYKRKYIKRKNTKWHESIEKPFKCHLCSKTYSVMSNLGFHIKIAHGERRFECKMCFKKLSRKHSLIRHMKLHEFQTQHQDNNYDSEHIKDTDNTCYPKNIYDNEQIGHIDEHRGTEDNEIKLQVENSDETKFLLEGSQHNYDISVVIEHIENTDDTQYPELLLHYETEHTDDERTGTENDGIKRQVKNSDAKTFLLKGLVQNYDTEQIEHADNTQYPDQYYHTEQIEHTDNTQYTEQIEHADNTQYPDQHYHTEQIEHTDNTQYTEQNYDTEQIEHADNTKYPDQYYHTEQIEYTHSTQYTEHNYDTEQIEYADTTQYPYQYYHTEQIEHTDNTQYTEQIEHADNTQYPDQHYHTEQIEHTDNTQYTEQNYETEQIEYTDEHTETDNKEIKRQEENSDDKTFLIGGSKIEKFIQNPFNRFARGSERVKYKRYKWLATGKKPFNCHMCSKAYRVRSNLDKHIAFAHDMNTKRFRCEKCSKIFMHESHLYRHMNAHEFQIQYPKHYHNPKQIEHTDEQTGTDNIKIKREIENPAETTFLLEGFKTEEYKQDQFKYKRYARPTTVKKPFRCRICSKAYFIERYFIEHINAHKRKELQCNDCPKIFRSKESLYPRGKEHDHNSTQAKLFTNQYHVSFFDNSVDQLDNTDGHETRKENNEIETKSSLNQDIRTPRSFECNYCKAEFVCKAKLELHIAIHNVIHIPLDERSGTPENIKHIVHKYQCYKCLRTFSANPFLIKHLTQVHNEKPYRCQKCSKLFLFEGSLLRHIKTHEFNTQYPEQYYDTEQIEHDDNTQNPEQYYDPEQIEHTVNIPYPDHDYVIEHIEHTDFKEAENNTKKYNHKIKTNPEVGSTSLNKSFVCDYCKKEFSRNSELERHIATFNIRNAAPNPCVDCAIVLCSDEQCTECQRDNILKNTQANSTDVTIKLEEPSRRTNSNGQTKNERLHKCQTCLRTYATEYWLMKHVCTGKRFECHVCFKRYISSRALNRHLETHEPSKFWCDFCYTTFTQKSSLYSHQMAFHRDNLGYHCHHCPKQFISKIDLERHVRRSHDT